MVGASLHCHCHGGYGLMLMESLYAQPEFRQKYGKQLPDGSFQISAAWQAGLSNGASGFMVTIVQFAMRIIGVVLAWFLLPHFGRRTLYLWGLAGLTACLIVIGGLGSASSKPSTAIAWTIGSMLVVYTFVYDIRIGPVCYTLVSEIPSVRCRANPSFSRV
ncbi:hypothetical protein V1517DRAFT_175873 [Lipomyces orientalis]|uniref:Uncharacterized protein n=1 Tax=Lipomyces orientalis TaxID=1233043 RepID=A0ACC3TKD2_9ASCO